MDVRGTLLVTDYFNNFNTDQPDFAGMRFLALEAEKASALAKKDFNADVYIRYPFKKCVSAVKDGGSLDSLHSLTRDLTYKGVQWKFVDDENPCDAPVIELGSDMKYTIDGKSFNISSIRAAVTIEDLHGNAVKGIFVRSFSDGSLLILNLFAPEGEYKINGKAVYLDKYAALTTLDSQERVKSELRPTFDVKYCNDNIIRTMHLNSMPSAEICANVDTEIAICVRNGETVCLNGVEIKCESDPLPLSDGMRALYKMSDRLTLKKGLSVVNTGNDLKYLPSVFLCGDFSYSVTNADTCRISLTGRKLTYTCGESLYDYGRIELTGKVLVPDGARQLELYGTELYTTVYADGVLLGERIASPYVFEIDSSLWNKTVDLKIVQCSSMAPIFGDVDYWDKMSERSQWRGTPSPEKCSFGFENLCWSF